MMPAQRHRSRSSRRLATLLGLLVLASVTMGSGTCMFVEEGYSPYDDAGDNEEIMDEQEDEIRDESNL